MFHSSKSDAVINFPQVEGPTFGRNCVTVGDRTFTLRWILILTQWYFKNSFIQGYVLAIDLFCCLSPQLLIWSGERVRHWCQSHPQRAKVRKSFFPIFFFPSWGGDTISCRRVERSQKPSQHLSLLSVVIGQLFFQQKCEIYIILCW